MKITELVAILNTTEEKIKQYENGELINPATDIKGNHVYHYKDLERLRVVLYLDAPDISTNGICKILVGTKNIGECLKEIGIL